MYWPQYLMLVLLFLGAALGSIRAAQDRTNSSVQVTIAMFIHIGWQLGFAAILHAGGFW